MALREILAVFGVDFDASALEAGNKQVNAGIEGLKAFGAALAGALALDKVKDFTLHMVEQADAIDDQAGRMGISTKALQEWQFAAGFAELGGERLEAVLQKLAVGANAADEGGKGMAATYKELGVKATDASGQLKTPIQLFEEVGLALHGMGDATKRTALAVQLFGRGDASRVLKLFEQGKPGLEAFRKEFEALGGAFDEEFIKASGEVDDNMKRLNLAWTTAKVRIAGIFLPALNTVIQGASKVIVWFQKLSKDTNIVQVGMAVMGGVGAAAAAKIITAYAPLLKMFGKWALAVGIVILVLEDLYTFLEGGDSLTGRFLDKAFGPGTAERVRAWVKEVGSNFKQFFTDLRDNPLQFAENFKSMLRNIRADIYGLGGFWGTILGSMFDIYVFVIDLMTGGWNNFTAKLQALWEGAGLVVKIILDQIYFAGAAAAAGISDAFTNAWNTVIGGAQSALAAIQQVLSYVPGLGGAAGAIGGAVKSLEGIKGTADATANVARAAGAAKAANAQAVQNVSNRLSPISSNVVNNVNVTVPPGTPANQAQAVAAAAKSGVNSGNRAAAGALVQQGASR